jgi:hypothetical protein
MKFTKSNVLILATEKMTAIKMVWARFRLVSVDGLTIQLSKSDYSSLNSVSQAISFGVKSEKWDCFAAHDDPEYCR